MSPEIKPGPVCKDKERFRTLEMRDVAGFVYSRWFRQTTTFLSPPPVGNRMQQSRRFSPFFLFARTLRGGYPRFLQTMNTPDDKPRPRSSLMSAEAIVGTGITILSLGVLVLLLGWAQYMRQVHDAAHILLIVGAVMFVLGAVGALLGRSGKRR